MELTITAPQGGIGDEGMDVSLESIEKIEQRVTNLEVAIHAIWVLIKCDLPESCAADDIDQMMKEHFQTAKDLGGCRRAHMDIAG